MTRGAITTPHALATEAGAQVMRDGGNAVDAAVAANAVLCVVYPHMTTIGGDLFALVSPGGGSAPIVMEGAGGAGSGASLEVLRERGLQELPERGALTVTVPGVVHAWGRLIEQFGTLGLQPVLEPAAAIAQDGFPVSRDLAASLAAEAGWLMRGAATASLFPPLKEGMLMRNPQLATTLRDLGRHGFNGFYRGAIASAIVDSVQSGGGLLTADDMALHRSSMAVPLTVSFRGVDLHLCPPPSQGITLAGMLARGGEQLVVADGHETAVQVRRLRDAVYPLRDRYVTDPRFAEVPLEPFLDPAITTAAQPHRAGEGGTIQLCTADEHGNVVSLMQSVAYPFGSGVVARDTGVLLQNRGTYFSLDPQHANRLAPRKRTMHTLMPAMMSRHGRPTVALGSMGSDAQPQILLQVILHLLAGATPDAAVSSPRVIVADGDFLVEADHHAASVLQKEGGSVRLMPPRTSIFGHAQVLGIDGDKWSAAADPRSDGGVAYVDA